ncbi:MAG TPA: isoaspartyl peptidase/L-asparaginase family protein [Nitrospirales bacterium]
MSLRRKVARPVILAHGGAGSKPLTPPQKECLRLSLVRGYELLRRGGSAIDAVEEAIRTMESSGLFNAGTGSRLQLDGARRMDAALMDGRGLRAGAVAGIEQVLHPISAARFVMERTSHVLIAGPPATRFARHFKLERQLLPTPADRKKNRVGSLIGRQRQTLGLYAQMTREETVGAVALDLRGDVAAGASTGGVACMLPGRVGDTPLIGCGVYADNEAGGTSMTGIGESIVRLAMAKDIVGRLGRGERPAAAARQAIDKLVRRIGLAAEVGVGALVVAPDGRFAIRHSSRRMAAGFWTGRGDPMIADRFG